jgi:hypothetical protein
MATARKRVGVLVGEHPAELGACAETAGVGHRGVREQGRFVDDFGRRPARARLAVGGRAARVG